MGWTSSTWLGDETAPLEEPGRGVREGEEVVTDRLATAVRRPALGLASGNEPRG